MSVTGQMLDEADERAANAEERATRAEAEVISLRRTLELLASHEPSWSDDFCRAKAALEATCSTVSDPVRLPDGSGCFTASWPLPKDHWLYTDHDNDPPMPMRVGVGPKRNELAAQVKAAARYAIRASTMNGKETDFDPDAMVQNMIVGLLGKWTEDGR